MKQPTFVVKFILSMIFLTGIGIAAFVPSDAEYFHILIPKMSEFLNARSNIPHPIVLVHGFGGSGKVWSEDYQIVPFFENLGLTYGGILSYNTETAEVVSDGTHDGYDFYAVNFSDNLDAVKNQAIELEKFIRYVRNQTRRSKVILVAFSMGGLTSRQYLTTHIGNHCVKKLVTIGTPHNGSPLALIYDFKEWAKENSRTNNVIRTTTGSLVSYTLGIIEKKARVFFNNPNLTADKLAVGDLRPPRNSAYNSYLKGLFPSETFLYRLNQADYPKDVEYSCVIGEIGLNADTSDKIASELRKPSPDPTILISLIGNAIINLFEKQIGTIDNANLFGGGDGAVSIESQNLNNIPFFRTNPNLISEIRIREGVVHLEECWHHEKIKEAIGQQYLKSSKLLIGSKK